jgi:hypothetical protein
LLEADQATEPQDPTPAESGDYLVSRALVEPGEDQGRVSINREEDVGLWSSKAVAIAYADLSHGSGALFSHARYLKDVSREGSHAIRLKIRSS